MLLNFKQKKRLQKEVFTFGARDRTRTYTPMALDPKSSVSANFTTRAFKSKVLQIFL